VFVVLHDGGGGVPGVQPMLNMEMIAKHKTVILNFDLLICVLIDVLLKFVEF
jgi:hypothetical protein